MFKPGLIICLLFVFCWAAVAPLTATHDAPSFETPPFPGWPISVDGAILLARNISTEEQLLAKSFPGRIGRFSDGSRELLIRWVTRPTRQLHPASDCFKGMGYVIEPRPLRRDSSGRLRSCFEARRKARRFLVCEIILDEYDRHWSDVSSWYWAAVRGRTHGPWWNIIVAEEVLES
jgi:hypothetical protein